MRQMFVLSRDWSNPDYDGRKKYGRESIRNLAKGTKMFCFGERSDPDISVDVIIAGRSFYFDGRHALAMLDISEPAALQTWDDVRLAHHDSMNGGETSTDVLGLLWQDETMRPRIEAALAESLRRRRIQPAAPVSRPAAKLAP